MNRKLLLVFSLMVFFLLSCSKEPVNSKKSFFIEISEYEISVDGGPAMKYPAETGIKLPASEKQDLDIHHYHFHQEFEMPEKTKDISLSLKTGIASYPYELVINGYLVQRHSRVDINQVDNRWQPLITTLDNKILHFGKQKNTIDVDVYTVFQTTPLFDIIILDSSQAMKLGFMQTFLSSSLVKSAAVFAVIIFFYFLYLYFLQGRSESKYLYMALFSLSYTVIYVNMTFNYPANPAFFLEKLSRMFFPIAVVFLVKFMMKHTELFSKKSRKILTIILLSSSLLLAFITFLMPSFTAVTNFFVYVMNFFLAPCLIFALVMGVVSMIRRKDRNSIIIFFGFLILMGCSIHDILYATFGTTPYIFLVVYGYLALIIAFFFVLAGEQAAIYSEGRKHAIHLNEKNSELRVVFDKITEVSAKLLDYTQKVEETTIESLKIMKQFEEGNRKIEADIAERFQEMGTTIEQMSGSLDESVRTISETLGTQNKMVNDVSSSINSLNERVELVHQKAETSQEVARNLSEVANQSTEKAERSTSAVESIQELSSFIKDVLESINDIAEETNVLSINASIEAARSGNYGKGFKVVANNIRGLANQSQEIVTNSFKNLQEIDLLVNNSRDATTSLGEVLSEIQTDTRSSADTINDISSEISLQKADFSSILDSVKRLSVESEKINNMSRKDREQKEQHIKSFTMMKESFSNISDQLNNQLQQGGYLRKHLDLLRDVMADTSRTAEDLHSLIRDDNQSAD